jgi:hypothetical protein
MQVKSLTSCKKQFLLGIIARGLQIKKAGYIKELKAQ